MLGHETEIQKPQSAENATIEIPPGLTLDWPERVKINLEKIDSTTFRFPVVLPARPTAFDFLLNIYKNDPDPTKKLNARQIMQATSNSVTTELRREITLSLRREMGESANTVECRNIIANLQHQVQEIFIDVLVYSSDIDALLTARENGSVIEIETDSYVNAYNPVRLALINSLDENRAMRENLTGKETGRGFEFATGLSEQVIFEPGRMTLIASPDFIREGDSQSSRLLAFERDRQGDGRWVRYPVIPLDADVFAEELAALKR